MTRRRVVITGLGLISPVGNTVAEGWSNLLAGRSGIGPITKFDASGITCRIAGEVKGFNVGDYIPAKEVKTMDTFIHYGIAAAVQVATPVCPRVRSCPKKRPNALAASSALASVVCRKSNPPRAWSLTVARAGFPFVPASIINMISGHVSIRFGFTGPNMAVVTACTTGLHCIGEAGRLIEYGDADVMVAGGAEATVSMLGVGGFASARALSTRNDDPATASRPWDKDRDGFVLGEGLVPVLEEYEHAKKRGAKIYAELIGFGMGAMLTT